MRFLPGSQQRADANIGITISNQRAGLWWLMALLFVLSGCTSTPAPPAPLPTEYIPTVIALTAQAAQAVEGAAQPAEADTSTPPALPSISPTSTQATSGTPAPSRTPAPGTLQTTRATPTPTSTATPTPLPETPFAEIQIVNLGPLAKVTSPIPLNVYLKAGEKGRVLIELLGEDRRLLFREIKATRGVQAGAWVTFRMDIPYEISAAAEAGRLQISVEDNKQRTIALNSVPLILLSLGEPDILPPLDLLAPIVIHQPVRKAMIQGGTARVSGLVRGAPDQFVQVRLLDPDGGELGSRLAGIVAGTEGDYNTFEVDVPYTVSRPTEALLVVTLGEAGISDVIHLSSVEVLLGP